MMRYVFTLGWLAGLLMVAGSLDARQNDLPDVEKFHVASDIQKISLPLSARQAAERLYFQAMQEYAAGRHNAADAILQQALTVDKQHENSRLLLITIYIESNRLNDAISLLQDEHIGANLSAQLTLIKAQLLALRGDYHDALDTLQNGTRQAVSSIHAMSLLAALYQRLNRFEDSIALYRQLVALQPNASRWWMALGISLEGAGRYQQATAAYEKATTVAQLGELEREFMRGRLDTLKPLSSAQ